MAEQNTYFDLTEELDGNVKSLYNEMVSNFSGILQTYAKDLDALCSKTHYEPMVKQASSAASVIESEVKTNAENVFSEWTSGDGCFHVAAQEMEAGENAIAVATALENNLKNEFDSLWVNKGWESQQQISTDRPVVKDEDYDTLENIFNTAYSSLEQEGDGALNKLDSYADGNPTYNLAKPALEALYLPLKNAFEGFANKAKQFKSDNKSKEGTMRSNAETAAQEVEANAIDADTVNANYNMFDNI